ncbi:MAG: hypothetical protein ACD_23C00219G0001, partial [uncultured bacterium]
MTHCGQYAIERTNKSSVRAQTPGCMEMRPKHSSMVMEVATTCWYQKLRHWWADTKSRLASRSQPGMAGH